MATDHSKWKLHHTMLRVKDPLRSIEYYKFLGLSQINKVSKPDDKFDLYFLGNPIHNSECPPHLVTNIAQRTPGRSRYPLEITGQIEKGSLSLLTTMAPRQMTTLRLLMATRIQVRASAISASASTISRRLARELKMLDIPSKRNSPTGECGTLLSPRIRTDIGLR